MSGHNKWSTIKHKKGRVDAQRGKLFTRLIREITISTKMGGKDPEGNPRLRSAVIAARGSNMPNDTIERAIKRGAGELEGVSYDDMTYEGFGPGGVAFFIEATTDNKNRTVAEIRHIFSKHGGSLGTDGSVAWMFDLKGCIEIPSEGLDYDKLFEDAVECGADDIEADDDVYSVFCEFTDLNDVAKGLGAAGYNVQAAKSIRIPTNEVKVTGSQVASVVRLMEVFDDQDDSQNVYCNADIDDEELEKATS